MKESRVHYDVGYGPNLGLHWRTIIDLDAGIEASWRNEASLRRLKEYVDKLVENIDEREKERSQK